MINFLSLTCDLLYVPLIYTPWITKNLIDNKINIIKEMLINNSYLFFGTHPDVHLGKKDHLCPECGSGFCSLSSLIDHRSKVKVQRSKVRGQRSEVKRHVHVCGSLYIKKSLTLGQVSQVIKYQGSLASGQVSEVFDTSGLVLIN